MPQLVLYVNSEEPDCFPKALSGGVEVTGSFREALDVLSPVVRLNRAEVLGNNYCYIPHLNRYYFIRDSVQVTKEVSDYTLEEDVLQSWYSQFVNCPVNCNRSASVYNAYIVDGERKFLAKTHRYFVPITKSNAQMKIGSDYRTVLWCLT